MIFNSEKVRRFIFNGARRVATIRKKGYYRTGQKVILKVGDKRIIGRVIVTAPVSSAEEYVKFSGFDNVTDWIKEAGRLHRSVIDERKFEIVVVELNNKQ